MMRAASLAPLAAALAVLAGLAACGHSPPTQFFTLDPVPAGGGAAIAPAAPVQLAAVHIPALLDRPQLVGEAAPNRLSVTDQDQWGAPLGELIRRALAQDLQARLESGTLILPGAPRPAGARALVVNVIEFQPGTDGRVRLQASWTLMAGKPPTAVLTRDARLTSEGAASGGQSQAAAMSELLGELSDRIAASLAAP